MKIITEADDPGILGRVTRVLKSGVWFETKVWGRIFPT